MKILAMVLIWVSMIAVGIAGMMWGWGLEPHSWGWIIGSYLWSALGAPIIVAALK